MEGRFMGYKAVRRKRCDRFVNSMIRMAMRISNRIEHKELLLWQTQKRLKVVVNVALCYVAAIS